MSSAIVKMKAKVAVEISGLSRDGNDLVWTKRKKPRWMTLKQRLKVRFYPL